MLRSQRQPASRAVAIPHRATHQARLLALFTIALVVLIAGCGASGETSTAPRSPDAAHQAWIAALRAGDVDAAVALTDPELPERAQFARDAVNRIQDFITNPASPTGPLESVTLDPVSERVGRSVWQFAQKRWCYRAELITRDERWFISRWGQTSVNCQ